MNALDITKLALNRAYMSVTRLFSELFYDDTFFLGNSQSLPMPLSRDEELEAFEGMQNGDAAAREKLIVHNLRLVVYIARRFEGTGIPMDDLVSIGAMGLIKAVNSFNLEKNIKLATYASRCIENEILMYLRKFQNQRGEVSIDEPLNVDWDGNELLLSDILGTEPDVVNRELEKSIEKDILHSAISALNPRERQIMELRFGLCGGREKTQKEVADIIGISQSYISRLEKRIIRSLRQKLENTM